MQGGTFLGYVSYGVISDRIGRKKTYVAYLLLAAALLPVYGRMRNPVALLAQQVLVGHCLLLPPRVMAVRDLPRQVFRTPAPG